MKTNDEALIQNLKDAGCDKEFISRFKISYFNQNIVEMLSLLSMQRKTILDSIHVKERQIYCLDYLVNTINKIDK